LWLLTGAAIALWVSIVLTWVPPANSPACSAGLDTLEALPATPGLALLDEVEAACGW
jgi:hypothetical protein